MTYLLEHTKKTVVSELAKLRSAILENHISADQAASGGTARSLRIEKTPIGAILFGRKYFGTLEEGRKEAPIPQNFTEIIAQWVFDKGIAFEPIPYVRQESATWTPKYTPEERGLMSLAGAISYKIKAEGTKLYREGGRKDIFTPEIKETITEIRKQLAGIYKTEIIEIPKRNNIKE